MARKIKCTQCGACCLANVNAFMSEADLERWREEGRRDILHILENEQAVWAGDRLVSARDGMPLWGCPFLEPWGRRFRCSIYETRPQVCRDYVPGSSPICPQYQALAHEKGI